MSLGAFIGEVVAETVADAIAAAVSKDPAAEERLALLTLQRKISDELARRELGVSDTEPPK